MTATDPTTPDPTSSPSGSDPSSPPPPADPGAELVATVEGLTSPQRDAVRSALGIVDPPASSSSSGSSSSPDTATTVADQWQTWKRPDGSQYIVCVVDGAELPEGTHTEPENRDTDVLVTTSASPTTA